MHVTKPIRNGLVRVNHGYVFLTKVWYLQISHWTLANSSSFYRHRSWLLNIYQNTTDLTGMWVQAQTLKLVKIISLDSIR